MAVASKKDSDREVARRIAASLRAILRRRGMSQSDMSRLSGIHQVQISNVMHSRNNPTVCLVARIASSLGVSIDELVRPSLIEDAVEDETTAKPAPATSKDQTASRPAKAVKAGRSPEKTTEIATQPNIGKGELSEWVTVLEASRIMGVHRRHVLQLSVAGKIEAVRLGWSYLVKRSSADSYQRHPQGRKPLAGRRKQA